MYFVSNHLKEHIIYRQQQKAERQNGRTAERSNTPEGLSLIYQTGYRLVLDNIQGCHFEQGC